MTKLKTLCFLMLAITVCVWSTQAAVEKIQPVRNSLSASSKLNHLTEVSVHKGITPNAQQTTKAASEIFQTDNNTLFSPTVTKSEVSISTKLKLTEQMNLTRSNSAVIQNADGSYTAAFKPINRGTGTLNSEALLDWSTSNDGTESTWQAELGYDGGYVYAPLFYYGIGLIPSDATVTAMNVDLHFQDAPWTPNATALFTINDLFSEYDGSTNYQEVYDDVMNTTTGNSYGGETVGFTADGTYNYVLNAQAVTDINTRIAASEFWFAIGLEPDSSMGPSGSFMMGTGYFLDPSVLYITYTAPGNNPVVTDVTAVPASQDNIGFGGITFTATWTDVDDQPLEDYGMIFQYRTPWGEEVQLSGGLWEKTGTGAYSWTGEWDPDSNHQIGPHDVSFLIYDGSFTDEFDFTAGDDLFTITSPAIEYEDFNGSDGTQWDPAMTFTVNPPTDDTATGESWQHGWYINPDAPQDYVAAVVTDYDSGGSTPTIWNMAQDCTITSSTHDCTTAGSVHFLFDSWYVSNDTTGITTFAIEGSTDGFATIADSVDLLTTDEGTVQALNWNATSWAAGQTNVQVRVHFVAPSTGDDEDANQAAVNTLQLVTGDAPVTITDTEVSPATADVITEDLVAFSVDFTASTAKTVDDFVFSISVLSDAGLGQTLLSGLYNGDAYGSVITENAAGDFTATISDLYFQPGIEIGAYDLMGYVSDGLDWDYDEFTDNEDELTLTTEAFWYEDFNDNAGSVPTGWAINSLTGGENGDDWAILNYTGTTDYFALVAYDQSSPADPQVEELRTGVIDCSTMEGCALLYSYEWASGYDENATGEIRISTDGGTTFTTIFTHTAPEDPANESGVREFMISNYADGEDDVVLSFVYTATDDNYWAIEIAQIYERPIRPIPTTGPIGLGLLLAAIGGLIIRKRK